MRGIGFGIILSIVGFGVAQTNEPVAMSRPDVSIVVREHKLLADEVVVTMLSAEYPPDLLKRQIAAMGVQLNSEPRGVSVGRVRMSPNNPKTDFVRASFAVDGLIDKDKGILNVEAIARAFAGAPEPHTIENLLIVFDGEQPSAKTVKKHASDSVEAEAVAVSAPASVEYRVRLLSQDPTKISFPQFAPEPSYPVKPSPKESGRSPLFYVAIALAAVAAGGLVYLALLRGGGPARR